MKHRYLLIAIFFVVSAFASENASADTQTHSAQQDESAWNIHPDGTVTVEGKTYENMRAYTNSEVFRAEGRRCGSVPYPVSFASPNDCSYGSTTIQGEYEPGPTFEIPVVVHVISNGGQGDIDEQYIHSQIDILNEDFRAIFGTPGSSTEGRSSDGGIQFKLATTDELGQPTTGIVRYSNAQWYSNAEAAKPNIYWDTNRFFNIYTNLEGGGILGYATFPVESAGDSDDGVVVGWPFMGRNAPMGNVYNQGRTGTHEVGHYLGLFHTFHDGCSNPDAPYTSGDRLADTQPEGQPQYECTVSASQCGGGNNPIHNYMDYTNDTCMDHFTPEQINRMRCSIVNYRSQLINRVPTIEVTYTSDGLTFEFTNAAVDEDGTVVSTEWDFGDGATTTENNPRYTFQGSGRVNVTFTATDDRGGSNVARLNLLPIEYFDHDHDKLSVSFTDRSVDTTNIVATWEWDFGDGNTSTEQNPTHVYQETGDYVVSLTVSDGQGTFGNVTTEITVDDGGCGCEVARANQGGNTPWVAGVLLAFGLALLRRRRRDA